MYDPPNYVGHIIAATMYVVRKQAQIPFVKG